MARIATLFTIAALFAAGCSAPNPFEGADFERLRSEPANPYAVRLAVDQRGGEAPEGVFVPSLLRAEKRPEIKEAVIRALKEYRGFPVIIDAEAAEATSEADLDLVVRIEAPPGRELGTTERTGTMWLNILLWLVGGFPGWILPDTRFNPEIAVTYEFSRPGGGEEASPSVLRNDREVILDEDRTLNFWRRAGLWQFVQQIIIPPPFVSSDTEEADLALYENYLSRIQRELGDVVKNRSRLPEALVAAARVPYLHVSRLGDGKYLFLLLSSYEHDISTLRRCAADLRPLADEVPLEWNVLLRTRIPDEVAVLFSERPRLARAFAATYTYGYYALLPRLPLETREEVVRVTSQFRGIDGKWTWTIASSTLDAISPAAAEAGGF